VVGIVTLSNEEKHVREMLNKVLDEADRMLGSSLIHQSFEII
jgi:superfamily II DNA/RNA helicase